MLNDPAAAVARVVETFERLTADGMRRVGGKWIGSKGWTSWQQPTPDDFETEARDQPESEAQQDVERKPKPGGARGDTSGENEESAQAEERQQERASESGKAGAKANDLLAGFMFDGEAPAKPLPMLIKRLLPAQGLCFNGVSPARARRF
jgi:hypothetical protein